MKGKSVSVAVSIAAFMLCATEAQTVQVGMKFYENPLLCMTSQISETNLIRTRSFKKQHKGRYSAVHAYSVTEAPSVQAYMFELIGAFAGGIIGAMPTAVMGLAYYPNAGDIYPTGDILSWHPILYGAAAGGILLGPYSVMRVGRRLNQNGSFWRAVVGSIVAPCLLGLAQPLLEDFPYRHSLPMIGIPLGAVIGYNL
jgi:hypothetical protein